MPVGFQKRRVAVFLAFARQIFLGGHFVFFDRKGQFLRNHAAQLFPICIGQLRAFGFWVNVAQVENFIRVNVADPRHNGLVVQHFLDGLFLSGKFTFQILGGKPFVKWFQSQLVDASDAFGFLLAYVPKPSEAPHIDIAQLHAAVQMQDKVRMLFGRELLWRYQQLSRHAKMQEQTIIAFELKNQELPTPVQTGKLLPRKTIGKLLCGRMGDDLTIQNFGFLNDTSDDLRRNDSFDGFNLWQFRHGYVPFLADFLISSW